MNPLVVSKSKNSFFCELRVDIFSCGRSMVHATM
uniref:Uncharacterized protein n=1 Tax=Rhizophora mucronata TaxID=61149 RepID=A0A2P2N406_RHIMU